ncbi:MAG: diguanylate cyclase [Usitatibacter sp.]
MKAWSIKARVAMVVALMFVAMVVAVSLMQMHFLRKDFTDVISDQQYSLVQRVARELDAKLETSTRALAATAAFIAEGNLDRPEQLGREFERQPALMKIFDDMLVLNAQGRIIAYYPKSAGRLGVDVSDRAYFREILATRRPVISEPLLGKVRGEPIVQIAAPILGKDDKLVGVLVGVIRLYRSSFIGSLGEEHIGETGYYVVLTRGSDPVYVSHPDVARILKPRPANGSEAVTRAIAGYQGTLESTSSTGIGTLYSSKLLRSVPWVLVAATPITEVFAPLQQAERRLWIVASAAAFGVMPLAWLSVWLLLAPLQRLQRAIVRMHGGAGPFVPVLVDRADEVGDLTTAFNLLMHQRLGAEEAQRESEARLRLLADNMPALISYLDADLRIQFANSCYREWFLVDPAQMIGKRPDEIFGVDSYEETRPHFEAALQGYPATYEREVETPTGARITRTVLFPRLDEQSKVVGIYSMTTDITADRRLQKELDRQARRDTLTGLHNRRSFEEVLPQAIARNARAGRWLALLFIDLDRFKVVNDTLGHGAGDDVLKATAERVSTCVRVTDTVSRLAGDEFTVILENLNSPEEAGQIAAKIIAVLERPITTRAGETSVGASIGVATCAHERIDPEELVKAADAATYVAKNAGRGRFHMAAPESGSLRLVRKP